MLDLAGGGVVRLLGTSILWLTGRPSVLLALTIHLHNYVNYVGGVAGLMLCMFAKFREWRDKRIKGHNLEVVCNILTYKLVPPSLQ